MKKIFATLIAVTLMLSVLSSCSVMNEEKSKNNDEYTDYPYTQMEYDLYVKSEMSTIISRLFTHLGKINSVVDGTYPAATEIDDVKVSLEGVNLSKEHLTGIVAPKEYEKRKETIIQNLGLVQETYNSYLSDLEEGTLTENKANNYYSTMINLFKTLSSI